MVEIGTALGELSCDPTASSDSAMIEAPRATYLTREGDMSKVGMFIISTNEM